MTPALLLVLALAAQEPPLALRLEVDATQVAQGESIRLDVVVTVRSQQQVEELSMPDVPRAFTVVQERRATSTKMGTVNGKRSVSTEQRYMFVLRADEPGTHRIGEASARLGRSLARTAPLTIKVTAPNDGAEDQAISGPQPGARFGNETPAAFLEVTLDKQAVWTGEQLTVTTTVFSQQPLSQWPRMTPVKPAGFFCLPLLGDERPAPQQRTIRGRIYYEYLVNKDALFATRAGVLSLPAQSVDLVPAGSFFARATDLQVKISKLSVTVKPLPEAPASLPSRQSVAAGNVGQWQLTASVRPTTAMIGQPFTLSLVATGMGHLDQLQLPSWDGGGEARVFPPTSRSERRATSADDANSGGRLIAEMLVQPLREGALKIPAFTLVTFDPDKGRYQESTTAPIFVPVKPAKGNIAGSPAAARQLIARGARPLHAGARFERAPDELPVLMGASCAAVGALALAFASQRRRRHASSAGQQDAARRERGKAMDNARLQGDLSSLQRVLLDALADAYGPSVRSSATSELETALLLRGAAPVLVSAVVAFIRDVEAARYMKGGAAHERERMASAAVELLSRIDGAASPELRAHGGAA